MASQCSFSPIGRFSYIAIFVPSSYMKEEVVTKSVHCYQISADKIEKKERSNEHFKFLSNLLVKIIIYDITGGRWRRFLDK